jgi:hypothetical protein
MLPVSFSLPTLVTGLSEFALMPDVSLLQQDEMYMRICSYPKRLSMTATLASPRASSGPLGI